MNFYILTLFPHMFAGPINESILRRAQEKSLVKINIINIRDFANNKHNSVDDYPYGGGAGMVIKAEPIFAAIEDIREKHNLNENNSKTILMCPQGEPLKQQKCQKLARVEHLIIICGHYEGIDERVREHLVDYEISIGDFVLTGGELPAMVLMDSIIRLIPGVLGEDKSVEEESFTEGLLEYPHYTRPADFRGLKVPEVLLSGNHELIRKWRKKQSIKRTLTNRPDLLKQLNLDAEGEKILSELKGELDDGY